MTTKLACVAGMLGLLWPAPADAQSSPDTRTATRPATTTPSGDTGLWFVPTGEILPDGHWSLSAYRVNFDYEQGFTDVSNWPASLAFGVKDRVELFGAFTVVNRIDRDVRPLYASSSPRASGVLNEHPFVPAGWTGNNIGDLWLGAKFNLASQQRQLMAYAVRGMVKLPTASDQDGAGTRRADVTLDGILSREFDERLELSGFGGFIKRGDPDTYDLLDGIRWGVGAAMPTRKNFRLTAEIHGEHHLGDTVDFTGAQIQLGTLLVPLASEQDGPINAAVGMTWLGRNGLFAGAGINWNLRMKGRSDFGYDDETGDALGVQFRMGYHAGVRAYAPASPPVTGPPPPAPAPQNRPPTVRARCEPCSVEVGKTATVTADAADPDGDSLTYQWSAASGSVSSPNDRQSPWTASMLEGAVPLTIEVSDGRGGRATDAITIQVIRPPEHSVVLEDVHFDFDRYSLRPEAARSLDGAVKALTEAPQLHIEIEGHTCNIGTAEYNLALGERRAVAVREYFASHGIGADRLRIVSYGEERPKHVNAREETRRLNRRAALIVRFQR